MQIQYINKKKTLNLIFKKQIFFLYYRLEKMRQAMESNLEEEILIQTSTGFFRFHGISEKFARKLYEWEQARGIGPEASTFTLLDPDYHKTSETILLINLYYVCGINSIPLFFQINPVVLVLVKVAFPGHVL